MSPDAPIAVTARLRLRAFVASDAPFIVALLNDPSFIANIADRGVRSEADALAWLARGPWAMQALHGFALSAVDLLDSGETIGMCGLLRRPELPDADIGYALLPGHTGQGYAGEAVDAWLALARERFGLPRVLAIVNPDNAPSLRLLARRGFVDDGEHVIPDSGRVIRRLCRVLA
jgi:RimJ/RimL family protein N-acetyltransferase